MCLQLYLLVLFFITVIDSMNIVNYNSKRKEILLKEFRMSIGGNKTLSDKEISVNNCLMQHKINELNYSFDNPQYFNMSHHYFEFKKDIRRSKVYQIIRDMPKGAALHIHDKAVLDADYFFKMTYLPDLYVCFDEARIQLTFSKRIPEEHCDGQWQYMTDARNSSQNITNFDEKIRKHFTVINVTDANVWQNFRKYFSAVSPLIKTKALWEQHLYDSLKKIRDDKVMYVELRTALSNLYDLDGKIYDTLTTARAFDSVVKKFKKDYPDFIGAKLIYSLSRRMNATELEKYLEIAKEIKRIVPESFAGFDLVGQEGLGKPLIDFVPQFIKASDEISYFFHAGETNWFGTLTDDNILDAILLGSKRIGHAFALPKHPFLMKEVLVRNICLETNVISNLVLSLLSDSRNHPLSTFISRGLPVVLSSDDPGAWEAEPLSDDFYVAFVGVASKHADLRLLKQLALNSLRCSELDKVKKIEAINNFNTQWNYFIDSFNCSVY